MHQSLKIVFDIFNIDDINLANFVYLVTNTFMFKYVFVVNT